MSGKNTAASVKQRLLNLCAKSGDDFQQTLTRYAVERLLLRLSKSAHHDSFVLKGAMLFALWTGELHRPTRDLDLLGYGEESRERLERIFAELCQVDVPDDGLEFLKSSITVDAIREGQEYGGQRIKVTAKLGQARIIVQVDVGFGDAITPVAETVDFPTLLGMESPRLRAYPKETVVAEKLEAIVQLGSANTRMKDFYDLLIISRTFTFEGDLLRMAFSNTFSRRGTTLPADIPMGLTEEFARDESKQKQWAGFLNRSGLEGEKLLSGVVAKLVVFLVPPLTSAARGERFDASWDPLQGWGS